MSEFPIETLIINVKEQQVYDHAGNMLGRTGDTKVEIDTERAKVYLTVNLICDAADFRRVADLLKQKKEAPIERRLKL